MRKWMEMNVPRRVLSLAVCACMVLSLLPVSAFAEGNDGLCEHHTGHTPECGYVEAEPGQECTHVCGDDCYSLATSCTHDHGAECYGDGVLPAEGEEKTADACTHACSEESGCVTKTPACVHTAHDEACGYAPAVAGQPCGYVCRECAGEPAPAAGDKIVTAWRWIDDEELLDEETGNLALPGASVEQPALFEDVVSFLPCEITATVDGAEEILNVDWVCDGYPEAGAYEGEYTFTAVLPQGYVLSEGVGALTVSVLLGGGETYAAVSQIPYLAWDNNKYELVSAQCDSATLVTSKDTKWTSGWYVVQGEVMINSRVEVEGDVNLILEDGCSLTVNDGIHVNGSNALYIYAQSEGSGMGRLIAESVTNGLSGIGGNEVEEVGSIYIHGGNITATGKEAGAGIGAGGSSKGTGSTGGFICIYGGIVNATGGLQAAGIGGGPDGKGGRIYIFGGTVIAHNGDRAACIGDGKVYWDNGGCKISIIGDATVIADVTITTITKRGTGVGTYNKQISDTFTCGASSTGVAPVIITSGIGANYTSPPENGYSISDTGHGYEWKGLIFEGDKGTIYGMDSFTLRKDLTIPSISGGRTLDVGAGKTLTVASGKTLTIPSGVTLAVNGTLINNGNIIIQDGGKLTLNGNMTVAAGGSLTLNGPLNNNGTLVFASGASVSGTGTYTGGETSPSLQGAVVLQGKYLHIHKLVNDRCACGYSEYIFITVSGIKAANKVYDGTVNATLDYSGMNLSGVKAGDKVSVTATGTFGNKNAGANKTVTITNLTLTGADASKYRLETTGQQTTATASITQKPVTAAVTVESKVYDGKNTAKVSAKVNSGLISGDSITITGLTGTFDNANAGTNKTVAVNAAGKSITGTGSGNYNVTIPTTAKGTITKAQAVITVEAGKNTYSKTYGDSPFRLEGITENSDDAEDVKYAVTEGTDVASVSASGEVSILKAGIATITLTLPESTNYLAATSVGIYIDVARKGSSVTISADPGKTYDGKPAVLTADGYTVTGDGDVTVEYKVKGADDSTYTENAPVNAGTYTVRVTQAVGTNFAKAEKTQDFTIRQKEVTITGTTVAESKIYDGNPKAQITSNGTLSDNYDGDNLTIVPGSAAYDTETVGQNKKVTFSGFALGGSAAGNYTLTAQPASVTANITAKPLSSSDMTVTLDQNSFVYDGTVKTPKVTVIFGTTTLVEGTDYTLSGNTATNADTYTLTVTGKGNYSGTDTKDWQITRAPITPVVTIANTVYGGTLNPSVSGNSGNGDVTYTYYSDAACETVVTPKNVGTYYVKATVAQTDNYQSDTSQEVSFRITKKTLTVTAKDHTITYGEAPANDGVTYEGFVNGETKGVLDGTLTYTYSYSRYGDVGSSYTITPAGLTSDNYDITFKNGTLTVQKKEIGITWGNTQFTYSGSVQMPSATPTGLVNNDAITLTVSGAQTNAGSDYTATVIAIQGAKAGNYALPQSVTTTFSIAKKEVTIQGAAVEVTKVYDGNTTAQITSNGILSDNFDGGNLAIVSGGASYDTKNVGENKPVTFSGFTLGGSAKDNYVLTAQPASVTADITAKPVTLTVTVKDKDFDGTTDAEIDTVKTGDFVEKDDVRVIPGTPTFAYANVGEGIRVSFTEFTLTGSDMGNYSVTNPRPAGVTASILATPDYLNLEDEPDFESQTEIWVDGVSYPVQTDNGQYALLPEEGDLLTTFTYEGGASALSHENYPTGMAVYRVTRAETGAKVERTTDFDDLLQYAGCSIRVKGNRGIRMITGLTKDNKKALKGAGLAGYTLVEYGTVVQWANELGNNSLTLENGKHNYAYKKGVSDPVFANSGDLTQYTNVLVWKSLTDEQLGQDIVMRPYIILRDNDGNPVTLYGGCVSRSIGYIASQNQDTFKPGTAAYEYVWDIIHAVYGTQYDSNYKG